MRTPAQTLERLAEVAPKGLYPQIYGLTLAAWSKLTSNSACDDTDAAPLAAWCKKQLRERGYFIEIQIGVTVGVELTSLRGNADIDRTGFETEWQAVAECLIAVLEKKNESN